MTLTGLSYEWLGTDVTDPDGNVLKAGTTLNLNGVYTNTTSTHEGRPVYNCTTNTGFVVYLWWVDYPMGLTDKWFIGPESHIGTINGFARVEI